MVFSSFHHYSTDWRDFLMQIYYGFLPCYNKIPLSPNYPLIAPPPQLIAWLLHYRYFILFPLAVVEGPFITLVAGFLVSIGQIDFLVAYGVIVGGDLVGDTLYYALGRWGGRKLIKRWERKAGLTESKLEKLESHFKRHPAKTLVLGKLAHGLGGPFLAAAGLAKMPYGEFLLVNLLATVPKSLILLALGFYFGSAYAQVTRYLDAIGIVMLVVVLVLICVYFIMPYVIRRFFQIKD